MAFLRLFGLYFLLTLLMMIVGFIAAGSSYGIVIFSIIAIAINLFSYFFSDSIVLRAYGAKVIERNDNPRLFGIVKKISDLNGLPMPRVAIVPSATPNAFATGRNPKNAVVAATTGIMSVLDDNELEGVMAHEMAHVELQHSMRNLVEMVGLYGIISAVLGDVSGIAAILVNNAPYLMQMKFSRDHEREADAMGFQYLMKANIDPRGMVAFFEKIQKEHDEAGAPDMDGALSMLSTHPATKERIANLNALIENGADSGPYRIIDLDFEAFQEKLKALLNE